VLQTNTAIIGSLTQDEDGDGFKTTTTSATSPSGPTWPIPPRTVRRELAAPWRDLLVGLHDGFAWDAPRSSVA